MALTKIVGSDGAVTFITGHNLCADEFELAIGQQLINTTCFADTYESNRAGLKFGRWSVSGKPIFDAGTTKPGFDDLTGTGGSITLTVATGCTEVFTGIIGTMSVRSNVNGEARLTFTGVTSGAVTEAWDETTS
jgi:hypothetical protein